MNNDVVFSEQFPNKPSTVQFKSMPKLRLKLKKIDVDIYFQTCEIFFSAIISFYMLANDLFWGFIFGFSKIINFFQFNEFSLCIA